MMKCLVVKTTKSHKMRITANCIFFSPRIILLSAIEKYLGMQYCMNFSSPESKAYWWAYRIGRPLSSVVNIFKHLLWSHHANWSQISYGASMGRRKKFGQTAQVTWPRWPPCPYMVKTLKIFFSGSNLETWSAASGAQVLPSLFKEDPGLTGLFYGKVKFGPLCFCMGKR